MNLWQQLHFLRPDWLWALLLVPLALLGSSYLQRRRSRWHEAVDAHLLPHLLTGTGKRRWWGRVALSLGLLLAVLALAGPSWRQVEQPLWESKTPLVIVLDLSSSIRATDLPPSRLLQARAKLATLLRDRKGGEVALIAYAWEPFTVAPLTDDAANVALFLDALAPEVMPLDGQKTDRALAWAGNLLKQSGARNGDVLLLTDHADAAAVAAATQLRAAGSEVSVLGLGSLQGASYRDSRGGIEHAHLDETSLRTLAVAGGGHYQRIASTDADLQALDVLQPQAQASGRQQGEQGKTWQDEGYWLLLPLLLLALFAFRRPRRALPLLGVCALLPMMQPAAAAEQGGWWQRADQVQHQRLSEGVDAYRQGDFATAQKRFEGIDSDQGWYNLGNALARQGRLDDAINAYDRALKLHPGMEDAVANRAAVDAARKRKSQQDQQNQQQGDKGKQPPQQGQDPQGQQKPEPQQGQQDPSQQGQQQSSDSKDSDRQGQQSPAGDQGKPRQEPGEPEGEDAGKQQQADEAQRQRMQEAMRQRQAQAGNETGAAAAARAAMTPQQREQQQAVDAWMQRVPDEPGDLLKAKFQLEYERRMRERR
ncbi:VWA domain-containing protein [Stenotrophomonas humi]